MNEQTILDLGIKGVWVAIQIAAPALLAVLFMGLIVSILQAATQINEQTMSFIPKILGMTITMIIFGPWIIEIITEFTITLFQGIPEYTHRRY